MENLDSNLDGFESWWSHSHNKATGMRNRITFLSPTGSGLTGDKILLKLGEP